MALFRAFQQAILQGDLITGDSGIGNAVLRAQVTDYLQVSRGSS